MQNSYIFCCAENSAAANNVAVLREVYQHTYIIMTAEEELEYLRQQESRLEADADAQPSLKSLSSYARFLSDDGRYEEVAVAVADESMRTSI